MILTKQYLSLVADVLGNGNTVTTRNGLVKKIWAPKPLVELDVASNFPILTDRKPAFYTSVLETCFFLSGYSTYESMPELLRNTWWKPWAKKAQEQKSWGRFYGTQWRNQTGGFDPLRHLLAQLSEVITTGVENRKMVVSLWHTPDTLHAYTARPAVLESCHSTSLCFDLERGPELGSWGLSLHHTQRSLDLMCGTGPDLIYSGLVMEFICKFLSEKHGCIVKAKKLIFAPVNVHIYEQHWRKAKKLKPSPEHHSAQVILKEDFLARLLENPYDSHPMFLNEAKEICTLLDTNTYNSAIKFELIG
jgi:thymidylate synthase